MDRKKRLIIIQVSLLVVGIIILLITYSGNSIQKKELTSILNKDRKINDKNMEKNVFYNIEYSGVDLAGNRYILKSKKAIPNEANENLIQMEGVTSYFYFKDETTLIVKSDFGKYNNNTLDIEFKKNILAEYEKSSIQAQSARYSNSTGFLTVSDNVKVRDIQGSLVADKLIFDIKKQTLNIETFNNDRISVNVDTNEKRF